MFGDSGTGAEGARSMVRGDGGGGGGGNVVMEGELTVWRWRGSWWRIGDGGG